MSKGSKFSLEQYPWLKLEIKEMQKFRYALAIGSLIYAQVCTHSDIAYIIEMLDKYLSNFRLEH